MKPEALELYKQIVAETKWDLAALTLALVNHTLELGQQLERISRQISMRD